MNTNDIIRQLRIKNNLTQDEMAEKLFVTRQAVSRWENGDTMPGVDTLKLISQTFDISINTLLGSPQKLVCQCCGMPLNDEVMSREQDKSFNEEYCKWCYADGKFAYDNMDDLLNYLIEHMSGEGFSREQAREYFSQLLPQLNHWKNQ